MNKNSVPNDPQSPFVTSGIRIGTPAVTRRGFKENEMNMIASWITDIIHDVDNIKLIENTKMRFEISAYNFQSIHAKSCIARFAPLKKVR